MFSSLFATIVIIAVLSVLAIITGIRKFDKKLAEEEKEIELYEDIYVR
jgi:hypothetical protein